MAEKTKDIGEIRKNGKEDADRIMVKVAEYKGKPDGQAWIPIESR